MTTSSTPSGFTDAERQAMKERAADLRAEKGGRKKADSLQALLDKIEELEGSDREIVTAVHQIVMRVAPDLLGRTWCGMPAWEKDGSVLVFVQPASKFGVRYATLGFQDNARLDDGDLWPTSFAVTAMTDAVRERIAALIAQAVSAH